MKKAIVLFDLPENPPTDHDYSIYEKDAAWDHEIDVKRALQRIGYEVHLVGVFNDVSKLIHDLDRIKPDLIFNMVESFRNQRSLESQVVGLLELLEYPFTGASSFSLSLCRDKDLTKKILSHHRIKVPRWVCSSVSRPIRSMKSLRFPVFVKPVGQEASEGISKDSFAENEKDCLERVQFLHEKFKTDVLIEEFVEGREIYASVLGMKRLQVFPLRELVFREIPDGEPRFATYRIKWNDDYRKKLGVRNEFAKDIEPQQENKIKEIVKKAFKVLGLQGFARFDLRLKENGEVFLIEANPNPSIVSYDDFAASARKAEISYDDLIQKLIDMGLQRNL
jgi:D-alanine-D-alanine ligase